MLTLEAVGSNLCRSWLDGRSSSVWRATRGRSAASSVDSTPAWGQWWKPGRWENGNSVRNWQNVGTLEGAKVCGRGPRKETKEFGRDGNYNNDNKNNINWWFQILSNADIFSEEHFKNRWAVCIINFQELSTNYYLNNLILIICIT